MQVTLCDTSCGNKVVNSKNKTNYCRIAIGETRYRVSIEITKPKQKFYRSLDLCEPCMNVLKLRLEELFSSFIGHGDPATQLLDSRDS